MITTKSSSRMMGALLTAIAYPAFLVIMLFGIVYLFSTQAVPRLAAVKDPDEWPSISKKLFNLAQFVEHKWWVVLLLIGLFIAFAVWSCGNLTGPVRRFLDNLPPWSIYKTFQASVFLISASAMMKTGKPIFEAISDLRGQSSRYVADQLDVILRKMEAGRGVGESMNSGFLDKETGIDIKVFGQTSSVDQAMDAVGKTSIENAISKIQATSSIINIFALVGVAGFILWIYYSFFVLSQSISTPGH